MALKVKAVEKNIKFDKNPENPGVWRYVMSPELYTPAESGEGHQGGSPAQRCEPRRDAGLLGRSR